MDSKVDLKTYIKESLDKHNDLRAAHGTPVLRINQDLKMLSLRNIMKFTAIVAGSAIAINFVQK